MVFFLICLSVGPFLINITAAGAVYREFLIFCNYCLIYFYIKNDLEPRGVIFPKYQPVASHGEPIQASGKPTFHPQSSLQPPNVKLKNMFLIFYYIGLGRL